MSKYWSWTYLHEGKPSAITYKDRPVLALDESLPSQYRQVLRVLKLLNLAEGKELEELESKAPRGSRGGASKPKR